MTARTRGRLAAVRQRATDSRGVTLTEMIVVLAILVVILTALTQLFVSASTAEVDMSNRVQAQQNARLALDKLRREIHCTREAQAMNGTALPLASTYPAVRFTLPSYCPTNPTNSGPIPATAYVTWCTAPVAGSSNRHKLWQYVTTNPTVFVPSCGSAVAGTTQRQWADYLFSDQVFNSYIPSKPSSPWAAATGYTAGQYVRPTNLGANPYLFQVSSSGTSGASEPTWPSTLNATVVSGATFRNVGPPEFALGRLSVNLPVDVQPADTKQRYTLTDEIVLRNTQR